MLYHIRKFIPLPFLKLYHFSLAFLGALFYCFPSKKIRVIGITGTKGKTTTAELVNAILEEAGYKTALLGTLRFKIGERSERNLLKMTMPGRFFIQRFLARAVREKCGYVIIEMTSEGAEQFRHTFIALDALIFTNLAPEHIESHGSYARYRGAKLKIAKALERSPKKNKIIIANTDDKEGAAFLAFNVPQKYSYGLRDAEPYNIGAKGMRFTYEGLSIDTQLHGTFNLYNILAASTCARAIGIKTSVIKKALQKFGGVPGRLEFVREGQPFDVVVDYAHTSDSLKQVYETFAKENKICVFGGAGGGRDAWKRKEFGKIAETYCAYTILTNEDPYDENPEKIISDIYSGFSKSELGNRKSEIIIDRRRAIRKAFELAKPGDIVIITGKGTDPYIMGPRGEKTLWDDRVVAREELRQLLNLRAQS